MEQAFQALMVIVIGVGGCIGYFYLSNLVLDQLVFPARGPNMGRNISRANMVRPWLFLAPALAALGLYLAYPVVATAWMSVRMACTQGASAGPSSRSGCHSAKARSGRPTWANISPER